jgi:hypothetical protein
MEGTSLGGDTSACQCMFMRPYNRRASTRTQEAVGRLVDGPRHVVLTPMVSVFADLLLMFLMVLWWLFLPSLILLMFRLIELVLLVLLLLVLVVALVLLSFVCNGAEFGVQLEVALERIKGGGHCPNCFAVWGFSSPESFLFKPVKLVLCRDHEGLMGDGGKFAIEVILVLMVDVHLEVMAGNHKVSFKKDANGVVNGCAPGN